MLSSDWSLEGRLFDVNILIRALRRSRLALFARGCFSVSYTFCFLSPTVIFSNAFLICFSDLRVCRVSPVLFSWINYICCKLVRSLVRFSNFEFQTYGSSVETLLVSTNLPACNRAQCALLGPNKKVRKGSMQKIYSKQIRKAKIFKFKSFWF